MKQIKDATFWAEKIKTKELSPEELHRQIAQTIQTKNTKLNAMVEIESMLKLQKENPKIHIIENTPFGGVPIPLKILGQEKKGWKNTAGSRLFKDTISLQTSHFVKKIEALGFYPFGQTNAPEFGFKNITDPTLYGKTKNPWNIEHHAGGSSGGAAAAVASGMYPLALASDGGGSIRIPASFNGLIGLKPTRGSMPVGPNGWRSWQGASINFALTVSMRDTETLFWHLQGSQKEAAYQAPFYSQEKRKGPLKIACCVDSPIKSTVSCAAQAAFKQAKDFLSRHEEFQLEEIAYPVDGFALIHSYYVMNGAETAAMFRSIEASMGRALTMADMEEMTWVLYQYGKKIQASEYIQALNLWDHATVQMEQLFQKYDLFLSPTTADYAPTIACDLQSATLRETFKQAEELSKKELEQLVYAMFDKSLQITPYTQLANLTGQPAISLPTSLSKRGLPIGIQFMASKGQEDLLFQIGKSFEQENQFCLPAYYQ